MNDKKKHVSASLLDSSLISTTKDKIYTHKIVECGDYYQVYTYQDKKIKKDQNMVKMNDIKIVNTDTLSKKENVNKTKTIELKNILRSKFQMQRLIKSNENIFKTFITLTFKNNVTDIEKANKCFKNWRDSIARKLKAQKKEFSYVAVPEFQKRGAVHYHLLSNIDLENSDIIIPQKGKKKQYDVRYWNKGYSSVFPMKDVNVVGYLTKYMTKDIDNRLWGKRRYLYSMNLKQPNTIYIDINTDSDNSKLSFIELFYKEKFKNIYCDKVGQIIEFNEYKKEV
jgi:hypothetical protein